jgi:3-oxoacyl-[acyl-carrier protein] reductase
VQASLFFLYYIKGKLAVNMDQTVLVTGASRGIGRAAAELFASAGYNVALNYLHSESEALALAAQLAQKGHGVLACRADVSDAMQAKELVKRTIDRFGRIDVLVNNAGIAQQKLFTDLTEDDWDAMMNVNLKSVFLCCREVLPHMIGRKSGSIVNVSSIWGIAGASCEAHYSAAKAAVIGLTKALAKELGPSNIRVNCVAPGVIKTDMISCLSPADIHALQDDTPMMRLGTAEDVAQAIFFLASDKAGFITGQVVSPNGGMVI